MVPVDLLAQAVIEDPAFADTAVVAPTATAPIAIPSKRALVDFILITCSIRTLHELSDRRLELHRALWLRVE